jgi:TonB family protein
MSKPTISLSIFGCLFLLFISVAASAQEVSFNYRFSFEPTVFDVPPEMGGLEIAFPEAARKNGVEGTVKVNFTLGEDGKVRDILIMQDLPFGVGDAASTAWRNLFSLPQRIMERRSP